MFYYPLGGRGGGRSKFGNTVGEIAWLTGWENAFSGSESYDSSPLPSVLPSPSTLPNCPGSSHLRRQWQILTCCRPVSLSCSSLRACSYQLLQSETLSELERQRFEAFVIAAEQMKDVTIKNRLPFFPGCCCPIWNLVC